MALLLRFSVVRPPRALRGEISVMPLPARERLLRAYILAISVKTPSPRERLSSTRLVSVMLWEDPATETRPALALIFFFASMEAILEVMAASVEVMLRRASIALS